MKPHRAAKVAALCFFAVLLFIIVYKAIVLPITYDEMSAAVFYPHFSVLNIIRYPGNWPSNHVLNSIAIKLTENLFGIEPWSVRLPNILAFVFLFGVLYAVACRYFYKTPFLFCLPFVIIFSNPYLLDFFGLARGYGMSNAFMAASVYCLLRYASSLKARWFFLTSVLSLLAAWANFTLLIFWLATHGLLVFLFVSNGIKQKGLPSLKSAVVCLVALLLSLLFIAVSYSALHRMQSTNQFVYWSKNSFFSDTLLDQIWRFGSYSNILGINQMLIAILVVIFLTVVAIYVAGVIIQKRLSAFSSPLVILCLLLTAVWAINMAQAVILGTPYLNGRTGLSYYVLFGFVLMFAVRGLSNKIVWVRNWFVPAMVIFFTINFSFSMKLNQVIEWSFDANTYQVINYMDNYRKTHPEIKAVDLNTTWLFFPSFDFYVVTGKLPWLKLSAQHSDVDSSSVTLFYYVVHEDAAHLKNYSPVLTFGNGNRVLMIRK